MFRKMYGPKYIMGGHHIQIIEILKRVISGEIINLIINIAPRYGKTELVVKLFISWVFAFNAAARFLHLSYSDTLALDNSGVIKDIIESEAFRELFGEIEIRRDKNAVKKWYTTRGGGVYATSTGGQVTGFGAGIMEDEAEDLDGFMPLGADSMEGPQEVEDFFGAMIIDDANKPEDAGSAVALKKVTDRYESTLRDRTNSRRTPTIIIGQRIDPDDLCGYLIALEPEVWYVLKIPAIKEDGTALYPSKHTIKELLHKKAKNSLVFANQYMQDPKPRAGLMYGDFETYKKLPELRLIKAYADTADDGADFLCSIVYGIPENREDKHLYLIDPLYTAMSMERTEPLMAAQLELHNVRQVDIESNNGGKGFARKINELTSSDVYVRWFFQSLNKASRIYTNSGSVNVTILMPEDWERRFPQFYQAITRYKKEGGNAHDDAPDTLTGCYEKSRARVLV